MSSVTTKRFSFTLDKYHRLAELNFFGEADRIELIRGEIMQRLPEDEVYEACFTDLLEEFTIALAGQAILHHRDAITLSKTSEPEPDFLLLRKQEHQYVSVRPQPEDVLLIAEISSASLNYEREVKLSLYAEAEISHYWIFNLADNHLEAYSEPYQNRQGKYGYSIRRIVLPDQTIALPSFPDSVLDLPDIFPDSPVLEPDSSTRDH